MKILDREHQLYREELDKLCKLKLPYEALQNQHILVTGANGMIGSYLVDVLLHMNYAMNLQMHVTALVRDLESAKRMFLPYLDREDFILIKGDMRKTDWMKEGKWDYIIHSASVTELHCFTRQPVEVLNTILKGTTNLLEYMVFHEVDHPVKKMVLLSTALVYGDAEVGTTKGIYEDQIGVSDHLKENSCYVEGKKVAETFCKSYFREYGVPVSIARFSRVYGAAFNEESQREEDVTIRDALDRKEICYRRKYPKLYSYCYIADAASAILTLLLKGEKGEVYNVSYKESNCTICGFKKEIANAFQVPFDDGGEEDLSHRAIAKTDIEVINSEKLQGIGWEPQYSLEAGVRQISNLLG